MRTPKTGSAASEALVKDNRQISIYLHGSMTTSPANVRR